MPPPAPGTLHDFCAAADLGEGEVLSRLIAGVAVAVARQGGRLSAFGALCPHQQADLSDGLLDPGGITCSWHLWRFDLATGECEMAPGASIPLFAAREQGGRVLVEVPADAARPSSGGAASGETASSESVNGDAAGGSPAEMRPSGERPADGGPSCEGR